MTIWPLPRRRSPGWALHRPATISITVDTTEPPPMYFWVYVEKADGERVWLAAREIGALVGMPEAKVRWLTAPEGSRDVTGRVEVVDDAQFAAE